MFMKGLLICPVCLHVCVGFAAFLSYASAKGREAPEQGSAQVEVMEGTGGDKKYREWRGVEQGSTGRDKYSHTQTTTTRDKRESQQ